MLGVQRWLQVPAPSAPGSAGPAAGRAPGCTSPVFPSEGRRKRLKRKANCGKKR